MSVPGGRGRRGSEWKRREGDLRRGYANDLAIRAGRLFVYAELKNKAIAGLVGWALVYACKPSEG